MRTRALLGALPPVLAICLATTARAAAPGERMLFLTLRFDSAGVVLESATVRPGHAKVPRDLALGPGFVHFLARDARGASLGEGSFPDPALAKTGLEYEDPDEPGVIRMLDVRPEKLIHVLRLPFDPRVTRVEFRRVRAAPAPGVAGLAPDEDPLGSVTLRAEELR